MVVMQVNSEAAMGYLGEAVARKLAGGETIELIGDVGAGKTTLVRGIAKGLGVEESVQSPTFTISREYSRPDGSVLSHYDFYRLDGAGIMADEIREASSDPRTIVLVEWADSVKDVLPEHRIVIRISQHERDPNGRIVDIEGLEL